MKSLLFFKFSISLLITFFATREVSAVVLSVSLSSNDGYAVAGTVDTTTDQFIISSWTAGSPTSPWSASNTILPLTLTARTGTGQLFNLPDTWNGLIDSTWGFVSESSNDTITWNEGNYTESARHFGWGGAIGSSGNYSFFSNQDELQFAPNGATSVTTLSWDSVSITPVPEPSSALLTIFLVPALVFRKQRV